MKKLYKYQLYIGQGETLEGVFVADEERVEDSLGERFYFGVDDWAYLDRSQLTVLTEDQEFVEKFEALMCEAGFNPLHHRYP